jgi:hypothetical protein
LRFSAACEAANLLSLRFGTTEVVPFPIHHAAVLHPSSASRLLCKINRHQ